MAKISMPIASLIASVVQNRQIRSDGQAVALTFDDQLPAATYRDVRRVLDDFGFAWSRSHQAHIGVEEDLPALIQALDAREYQTIQKSHEFFPTSADLASALAKLLANDIMVERPVILEPSAGNGALVAAILEHIPTALVIALEPVPKLASALRTRFADDARVDVRATTFETFIEERAGAPMPCIFDGILMNPPFRKAQEHIALARSTLRRGDTLISVAPPSALRADTDLGRFLAEHDAYVESLGPSAFKEAGTNIETALVQMRAYTPRAETLSEVFSDAPSEVLARLQHLSLRFGQLSVDYCNRPLTAAEEAEWIDVEEEAREIGQALGASCVMFQRDPRGSETISLSLQRGDACMTVGVPAIHSRAPRFQRSAQASLFSGMAA